MGWMIGKESIRSAFGNPISAAARRHFGRLLALGSRLPSLPNLPSEPLKPRPARPAPFGIRGFTLLELLVVLVILGLLAGIAVPRVMKYVGEAKTGTARIEIENLGGVLDLYRLDIGRYPLQSEGLDALLEFPLGLERWNGPYLKKRNMLSDPWENPYVYRFPGEHGDYDLYSLGADNTEGGEGEKQDIVSW